MWSLHVEVSFYVVLPLIGLALLRARRWSRAHALIAAGLALDHRRLTLQRVAARGDAGRCPTYIGVLTCGVLAAVLAQRNPPRLVGAAGVAIVLLNSWWHSRAAPGAVGHIVATCPRASASR